MGINRCWISIDIEADGPIPSKYSMISLGAVVVDKALDKRFYGELRPISNEFVPEALAISGFSRDQTMGFEEPKVVMERFRDWIKTSCNGKKPYFIADNNGFDWQFVNWYFHYFLGENPFGFSSTNLRSLYQGLNRDMKVHIKHLRQTKHTHNALDDALGNAEALLAIHQAFGIKNLKI